MTAIKLHGVTAKDFEKFCWVFYNSTYSLYDASVSDWGCILHLGHDWQFSEVEKLAVRELEKMGMSTVDRIALYHKHNVSEDLLIPHYAAVCTRGSPLDFDESERLGMLTVVLINQAMHAVHMPRDGDGNLSPINPANAAVISKIVVYIGNKRAVADARTGPPGGLVTVSPFLPMSNSSKNNIAQDKAFPLPMRQMALKSAPPSVSMPPVGKLGSPMAEAEPLAGQINGSCSFSSGIPSSL